MFTHNMPKYHMFYTPWHPHQTTPATRKTSYMQFAVISQVRIVHEVLNSLWTDSIRLSHLRWSKSLYHSGNVNIQVVLAFLDFVNTKIPLGISALSDNHMQFKFNTTISLTFFLNQSYDPTDGTAYWSHYIHGGRRIILREKTSSYTY